MNLATKSRPGLTKQLLIRVPPDLRARLEAVAAFEERSMSATARRFIRQGLDRTSAQEPPSRARLPVGPNREAC